MAGVASRSMGLEATAGHVPVIESDALRAQADALARDAEHYAAMAAAARGEAALLRAKADRLDDPSRGVTVAKRAPRARRDGLTAAAGVAVEDLKAGFSARDLAAALGIADVQRAGRLLVELRDFGKVARSGDGWMVVDPDEGRARDYVVANPTGTIADVIAALSLTELDASHYLHRLRDRGVITLQAGHYEFVPSPGDSTPREKRRPPEKEPPAGTEAPARGVALYTPNHGKRGRLAQRGGRHQMKQRDARREAQERAREQRAEEQARKDRAAKASGKKKGRARK